MKLLALATATALLTLGGFAPLDAEAQVSRKDYERRSRTTASAESAQRSTPSRERATRVESRRSTPRTSSRSTSDDRSGASPPNRARADRGVSRKSDWSGRGRPVPAERETARDRDSERSRERARTTRPAPRPQRTVPRTRPAPRSTTVYRAPAPPPPARRRPVYRRTPGLNVSVFLGTLARDFYPGNLNRWERERFQRDLEARALDLQAWAVELERREAFLERRRPRVRRVAARYDLPPARRLRTRELYQWDELLQRRAVRLDNLDREVTRRERRRNRRWRRGVDDGWVDDYRPEDYRRDPDYCPPGW